MKSRLFSIVFIGILIAVAFVSWAYFNHEPEQSAGFAGGGAALVTLQPARLEIVADSVEAVGTLIANESITVTSKVSDIVTAVHFEDGDIVEAGYILVELLNQEQSALLAEAQANLIDTNLQLERLETLGSNVASASQIDEARARAGANQARLDAIISRMEDRLIRAPFSGMLGFRDVSIGTLVNANTSITTLDDISVLELDFSIPETAFGAAQIGDKVEAQSAAYPGLSFEGQVASIGSRIDPVTRTAQIRARISNEEQKLRPGMFMTLSLVAEERELIVIPEAALLQRGDRSLVYVANDEMKVAERDVVIDRRLRGVVVIADGLEEGEMLVVDGIGGVRNGAQVRLPSPPSGATAPGS